MVQTQTKNLQLGDLAPDFEAETTEGRLAFHAWLGNAWCIFFSHPKDFTPVCTTELGYAAKIKAEFDKRHVKMIALSVDSVETHRRWIPEINATQHTKINFPLIGDADHQISLLFCYMECFIPMLARLPP